MNLQSSRVRDQVVRIIRHEIRKVLRNELQSLQQPQVQQQASQHGHVQPALRKVRRLQPIQRLIGNSMLAPPQPPPQVDGPQQQQAQQSQQSQLWPSQQAMQQPSQQPNVQQQQLQSQGQQQLQADQVQQQLAQEIESNLLKLKKVISETQALAEKMESFLKEMGRRR